MAKKPDARGGNGDIIFTDTGTARKYLRNTSGSDKILRFKRELEIFEQLRDNPIPNIVEVVDVHWSESKTDRSYVEMKQYDGSLYDLLPITKGNVKKTLELILPIIRALSTLSEHNPPVYHRDIKPDNILFLTYLCVVLLHMGTGLLPDQTSISDLPAKGILCHLHPEETVIRHPAQIPSQIEIRY